jgi:type IX secretion system PorP/SprF family membrane protein
MKRIATLALLGATLLAGNSASAQDVHFTQFDASPLLINPAFTGAHNGKYRAAAIYRDQWRSIMGDAAFKTVGASIDAPIVRDLSIDDYLAAGLQFYNDRAGDGNLANNSILASVAYHKFLGSKQNMSLSVGLQGGYTQKSIDLSKLYFGDEFRNGVFQQGTSAEYPGLGNKVDYFTVNAGVNYSIAFGENFGITLGGGANNLTQPDESVQRERNAEVGLGMRYTGQAGAIVYTGERLSIRPAVLYQSQSTASEIVAGSEFNYIVGNTEFRNYATAVFIGAWHRLDDAVMATAGVEFKGFRVGVSYDYNISTLDAATNGNGGFEISLRYIAADPLDFARRLLYPCARF